MYTHSKFDHEYQEERPPRLAYFICSTPRCGSSLLCEALTLSGVAAIPTEYFDQQTRDQFCKAWKIDNVDHAYLDSLLRKKTNRTGVFGVKTHFHQYQSSFGTRALPTIAPDVRFIWVSRSDTVAQAVSYWRAIQTNQWASTHGCQNASPEFNRDEIQKLRMQTQHEQEAWARFFQQQDLNPLQLEYEDFSEDPIAAVRSCLNFLSLEDPDNLVTISNRLTLQRQSDSLSVDWIRRYRELS